MIIKTLITRSTNTLRIDTTEVIPDLPNKFLNILRSTVELGFSHTMSAQQKKARLAVGLNPWPSEL